MDMEITRHAEIGVFLFTVVTSGSAMAECPPTMTKQLFEGLHSLCRCRNKFSSRWLRTHGSVPCLAEDARDDWNIPEQPEARHRCYIQGM